jgi:hypothetical protein
MAEFLKKTVKPSGGDYTSLEACMNANEQDLTGDGWFTVEIDGDWSGGADTSPVTIHNYTTTSSDYINIYTKVGDARHDGKRYGSKSTAYKLEPSSGRGIYVQAEYVTIKGLQIQASTTSWQCHCIEIYQYKNNQTIINNIFKGSTGDGSAAIYHIQPRGTNYIYNNLAYNFTGSYPAFYATGSGAEGDSGVSIYFYNNTGYNIGNSSEAGGGMIAGISADSTLVVKNNLAMNFANPCYSDLTRIDTGSNNASSDGTADDSPLTSGVVDKTSYSDYFVSVSSGSEDFHLKSTATDFIGAGADLSTTFNDDIDGVTRSGTWDIGADEYVAAASSLSLKYLVMEG